MPPTTRVRLNEPPVVGRDARVSSRGRLVDPADGVYAVRLTAEDPSYWLTVGRQPVGQFRDGRIPRDLPAHDMDADLRQVISAQAPLRGGQPEPFDAVRGIGIGALSAVLSDVPPARDTGPGVIRVLATEAADRPAGGNVRAIVAMYTLPSGARLIAGGQIDLRPQAGAAQPVPPGSRLTAAELFPAGRDADVSFAWRQPTGRGPEGRRKHPGWTGALGPAGTSWVRWTHQDGSVTSSPAVHTLATTPRNDVVSVRYLGAGGKDLGSDRVTPKLTTSVLPEIEDSLR